MKLIEHIEHCFGKNILVDEQDVQESNTARLALVNWLVDNWNRVEGDFIWEAIVDEAFQIGATERVEEESEQCEQCGDYDFYVKYRLLI